MKVYRGHIYQPREEIPDQLKDFDKSIQQYSTSNMADAQVHLLYVDDGTQLTDEYQWIKENATHVVALVLSNKFRRFAPKELTWQACYSLKRRRDIEDLVEKVSNDTWSVPERKPRRVKGVQQIISTQDGDRDGDGDRDRDRDGDREKEENVKVNNRHINLVIPSHLKKINLTITCV